MPEASHKGNTLAGIVAATAVYAIYGLNAVFCKDLTNDGLITPTVLFTLRTGGAALLFWLLSLFVDRERLSMKELGLAVLASVLCIILPQYSTLIGITMSTPYDTSLVSTIKPVLTMTLAFLLGKEKFSPRLLIGVLLTFAGAVFLVIRPSARAFTTSPLGFLILLVNGISFAFYLVLASVILSSRSHISHRQVHLSSRDGSVSYASCRGTHQHFGLGIILTNQFCQTILHIFSYCYVAQCKTVVTINRTLDAACPCEWIGRTKKDGFNAQQISCNLFTQYHSTNSFTH